MDGYKLLECWACGKPRLEPIITIAADPDVMDPQDFRLECQECGSLFMPDVQDGVLAFDRTDDGEAL